MKNTTAPTPWYGSHHQCHECAMPLSDNVPAAIATLAAASTSGSSYAISCAPARRPPSREYLLALAQPAMRMPSTPTDTTARAKNTPTERSCTLCSGPTGIAMSTKR